jgi:hypothetical protein
VITVSGDALFGNEDGGGLQQLFAQSETVFSGLGEGVEFVKDANGVVTHLMRKQVSSDYRFERKK